MKRIVSVSIGSSSRDKCVETDIMGYRCSIERIGTNGSIRKAIDTIKELDGKVDAFGMGGIDLYLTSGSNKRHVIREAVPIKEAARNTPIVDGTGIKNTLEKNVIDYIEANKIIDLKGKRVLITSAADRFRMAKAFVEYGCDVIIGDLIFALGIPIKIKRLDTFRRVADAAIPIVSKLPFEMLYPTGDRQKENNHKRFSKYYWNSDIIAGDYHYIKKYMPENMEGKIVVTNTVTPEDVNMLRARGVMQLVTTTPEWDGRSFGTNVVEALIVSLSGKNPEELSEEDYHDMLNELRFRPRVEWLN
ncbi:MAG: quinate 5-dehydrogenase [Clostridia bacterium]|nr:quinate 5-dehydrogenase [Clostridia bacterium]